MESYTVPEAAKALGRSLSNFRRWLDTEIIPAPVLSDTGRSYACYCVGELEIIAQELREHERNFVSLCASHTDTILRISQRIHGFRDTEFEQAHLRTR
jgi:hypothetical protein